jgi:DNA-binding transcriptional ArsR family regulator
MVEHPVSIPALDETYASLSHSVRRDMLTRLRDGELRVTELAAPFSMSLAAASKHIGQLEQAGLVRRRIAGRDHWISLRPEPLEEAAGWLALYRSFWNRRLDRLEDVLKDSADG